MQRLYDVCGDYELPMLFHVDGNSCMDEVGFDRFDLGDGQWERIAHPNAEAVLR